MTLVYVYGSGECDQLGKFGALKWPQKIFDPANFDETTWKKFYGHC